MEITNISAYEMREKLLNKEIKAVDIVNAHLEKINELKDLNAFITINEESALESAKKIDEKIANGETLGALAGIPISIKDNISTKGIKTTCGSKMLENYVPPFNASVIDLIEEEDGIVLGKTNLDEFAVGSSTENSYFGITKNHINNDLIPGGSSGGSTVSVGSYQVPLSLGTDTGGSVRQPSAYCKVVGIKPTYGAISRYGVVAMANSLDQVGIIGRNVKDSGLLLKSMMKKDLKDLSSFEGVENVLADFNFDEKYDFKDMKIAVVKNIKGYTVDEEVAERFDRAVELVEKLGGKVEVIDMEAIAYGSACYHVLSTAEVSSNMGRFDGVRYGYRSENYTDLNELYINSRTEAFGKEVKRRIMIGTYVLENENREKYYVKALKIRRMIRDEFNEIFKDYDLIISPTAPTLPFEIGKNIDNTEAQYNTDIFTVGVNLAGICAISIPFGKEDEAPVGIQFVANKFEEDKLLKAGLAFEGGKVDEL